MEEFDPDTCDDIVSLAINNSRRRIPIAFRISLIKKWNRLVWDEKVEIDVEWEQVEGYQYFDIEVLNPKVSPFSLSQNVASLLADLGEFGCSSNAVLLF